MPAFSQYDGVPWRRSRSPLSLGLCCELQRLRPGKAQDHQGKADRRKKAADDPSVEPDKVLYDRAMKDMKQRRYIEARLNLQTLINTYPDSEFLAKAKLAVADSFYKEGGTSNFTQAVDEYKNFIVFFPFLEESAYAQMQVAMAHYRMMEKSDRDNSQAQDAESEFQIFLKKYPDSPLRAQAEQSLRNVQEVIADGEFRIGRFYYDRARINPADYQAAAARLVDVSQRYPLYSQTDQALWMLAEVYERVKKFSKNEDDKNHWSDLAAKCYARIVTDYPLSKLAPAAKARLQGMGLPVPPADPEALAREEKDRAYQRTHRSTMLSAPVDAIRTNPGTYSAARAGTPTLNPPDDAVSATDVLKQGALGPLFGAELARASEANSDNNAPSGAPNIIEGPALGSVGAGASNGVGAEIIEAPSGPAPGSAPAPAADSSSSSSSGAASGGASSSISSSGSGTADIPTGVVSTTPASMTDSSEPAGQSSTEAPPASAESVTAAAPAAGALPPATIQPAACPGIVLRKPIRCKGIHQQEKEGFAQDHPLLGPLFTPC